MRTGESVHGVSGLIGQSGMDVAEVEDGLGEAIYMLAGSDEL